MNIGSGSRPSGPTVNVTVNKGANINRYRELDPGELLEYGDELYSPLNDEWQPCLQASLGTPARAGTRYRRPGGKICCRCGDKPNVDVWIPKTWVCNDCQSSTEDFADAVRRHQGS